MIFSEQHRFSLGIDLDTGQFYLGIPVSNRMADYTEFYIIDGKSFEQFRASHEAALPFVEQARARKLHHLLILQPGTDRGVP